MEIKRYNYGEVIENWTEHWKEQQSNMRISQQAEIRQKQERVIHNPKVESILMNARERTR